MPYKISVIIPVYNAENEIATAIDSVINQTFGFDNIELIIVDDASTDNTKEVVKDYQKTYDNIHLIELAQNSGFPGKPRSIGLENATSEYIIFLDSDDAYQKEAFETYFNTIEHENADMVISSHFLNLDGDMIKAKIISSEEEIISINPMETQENFNRICNLVAPWGKIFKKEAIINNNIKFPEDCLCEDAYFYLKVLINSKKVIMLPKRYLYVYNTFENKETAIHGHDLEKFNDFLKGFEKTKNLLKTNNISANHFLYAHLTSLLLIFSNLKPSYKKQAVLEIYEFEKDVDIKISRKEVKILNDLILKKKFRLAILISNLYSFLYNSATIKNLYRKYVYK